MQQLDPRYEYDDDGSIVRLKPRPVVNPLRCAARPHGLGAFPSVWKAANDHDRAAEPDAKLAQSARIASHQYSGGFQPPKASNDNHGWPLLKALRQDGKDQLIAAAERYQALWHRAHTVPLGTGSADDLFVVPRYSKKDDPDNGTRGTLEITHTAGDWAGGKVLPETGMMASARAVKGKLNPTRRATKRIRTDHTESIMAAILDARVMITRLHGLLGPLVEPFEAAVITGATLTEIGEAGGIGQHAAGAGKLVVMMGLEVVAAEFQRMRGEL